MKGIITLVSVLVILSIIGLVSRCFSQTAGNIRVVAFTAKWCVPCQEAKPTLRKLEKLGVIVDEIDVDDNPRAAKENGVTSLPTFFVMMDGRTLVFRNEKSLRKFFGMK